jgi:hypothetical protein
MTDPKENLLPSEDTNVDEAFARFIRQGAGEIAQAHQRVRERQEEVRRGAREVEAEIGSGIRPKGKRFRL